MKILITGSEGSLMQAIIPKLLEQGHQIVGVDNLYRHGRKSKIADKDYKLIIQDLTDRQAVIDLCKGFDAVFLAAAKIYGVGGFNHYCADIIADDVAIQGNILHGCAQNHICHVVYISSSMVYETCIQDKNVPVVEEMVHDCVVPKTEYGLSKLIGERMCQAFYKQYGIEYTIWRPFNIITPYENAMTDQGFSHVFADFIDNIVRKKMNPLPIIGDGNQIRCFTWINDIANIIANHSFDQKTKNQAFNICNVEPITMKDLAIKIHKMSGGHGTLKFETKKHYANDVVVRIPSVKNLIDTIGPYQFQAVDQSLKICLEKMNMDPR
jgi:nucleoside-diphosphate-sugar epimerase